MFFRGNSVTMSIRQHACSTSFEGLAALRQRQADEAVKAGIFSDTDAALADADTICYDYDLMDKLIGTLKDSGYNIENRIAVKVEDMTQNK